MSLDVHLISSITVSRLAGTGVFVRDGGVTRELTHHEVAEKFPEAIVPVSTTEETNELYHDNITHNLTGMADAADLYQAIWHPEELDITTASELSPLLDIGLRELIINKEHLKTLNPSNGWGSYDYLVEFTAKYLEACLAYPAARVEVSR